jgi:hypothetical protein
VAADEAVLNVVHKNEASIAEYREKDLKCLQVFPKKVLRLFSKYLLILEHSQLVAKNHIDDKLEVTEKMA